MKCLLSAFLIFGSFTSAAQEKVSINVMANLSKCVGTSNGESNLGLYLETAKFGVELDPLSGTEVSNTRTLESGEGGEIRTQVVLTEQGLFVLIGEYVRDGKVLATSFLRQRSVQESGFLSAFSGCSEADTGRYLMNLYYQVKK